MSKTGVSNTVLQAQNISAIPHQDGFGPLFFQSNMNPTSFPLLIFFYIWRNLCSPLITSHSVAPLLINQKHSPSLASSQHPLLQISSGTTPQLFLSYIDNCIGAPSCTHGELLNLKFTISIQPALQFIGTISPLFHDLSVTISEDKSHTDIYHKSNSHCYPD